MNLSPQAKEVIQRIIKVARPERIIVFGSHARGESSPDSDLDVFVVKDVSNRKQLAGRIYRSLIGVGIPVDVVVVRPDDIERFGSSPSLIIHPAIRDGETVYAA